MNHVKILHMADVHYRDKDYAEIQQCMEFIISKAHEEQPHVIIVAGDIFDRQDVKVDSNSARVVISQLKELSTIAPVAVILGTPSHDGRAPLILDLLRSQHYPIWVSEFPEQIYLLNGTFVTDLTPKQKPDIIISQFPTPTKRTLAANGKTTISNNELLGDISNTLKSFAENAKQYEDTFHVLSGHFHVAGARINETQVLIGNDVEIPRECLKSANADLYCIGHIHQNQKLWDNVFYSGSIIRNNFGELTPKGFYIHEWDISYGLKDSIFIETPARMLIDKSFDFTDESSIKKSEFNNHIIKACNENIPNGKIKISVDVYQDMAVHVDWKLINSAIMQNTGAEKVIFNIIRKPRMNIETEEILKIVSLEGKIKKLAKIREEVLPDGITEKTQMLESAQPDDVVDWAITHWNVVTEKEI
jgi:DNA repair exonuclease SbcCD nuclease subunit